jgi:SAM-dependent methyltransferase
MRSEMVDISADGRMVSPSAQRNAAPICEVLASALPAAGLVLEIGSGTGQHIVQFARALPGLRWQPSECDDACLRSIAGWLAVEQLDNVAPPVRLDVHDVPWPVASAAAVVCINMIHIAPFSATRALLRGAQRILPTGGLLYLYGPFHQGGVPTSSGNARFDAYLRAVNPRWGLRDVDAVGTEALAAGLALTSVRAMPANNVSILLHKRG